MGMNKKTPPQPVILSEARNPVMCGAVTTGFFAALRMTGYGYSVSSVYSVVLPLP